jgi:hypothetical protein
MSRYNALRRAGIGPFASALISSLNYLRGIPAGKINFLTIQMEYEP